MEAIFYCQYIILITKRRRGYYLICKLSSIVRSLDNWKEKKKNSKKNKMSTVRSMIIASFICQC